MWETIFDFRNKLLSLAIIAFFCLSFVGNIALGQDLPPALASNQTIPAGSLVIAMDNTNQALTAPFNLKAYGLVDKLLQNGIPVIWSIKAGKAKDGIDFSANVTRIFPTSAAAANQNFSGGPFIIHRDFVPRLGTLVSGFGNNVAVYRLNADAPVDVRYIITFKPKIAVGSSKANVHTNLYDFALIPEYTVVTETVINSSSCYTLMSQPHTNSTAAVSGIKAFVQSGGNFTAQCLAIPTYENDSGGRFLTDNGITINNVNTPFTYPNADMAFGQFIGIVDPNPGGSETDWSLNAGSNLINGGHIILQNSGTNTDKYAAMASKMTSSGSGGMTFYLGGHDYGAGGNDITLINGQRMVLNTVFVPPARSGCGFEFPGVVGYKSVKVTDDATHDGVPSSGDTLTWTLDYANIGSAAVNGFQIADVLPAGLTFLNITVTPTGSGTVAAANGGYNGSAGAANLLAAGAVLGVNGRITVSVRAKVNSNFIGTLANQATGTGTGLPGGGILTDNIDNLVSGLLGGTIVPAGSYNQTKNDSTLDPTTIQIVAPTAVQLEKFDSYFDGATVTLEWSSGAEVNNLGFNIYREVSGKRELINPAPIAGNALRSSAALVVTGGNYQWTDEHPVEPGTVYYLEDIDMNGNGTIHGPVSPTLRFTARSMQRNPLLLTDLTKPARPAPEKEFVERNNTAEKHEAQVFSGTEEERQWEIASKAGVKISVNRDALYRISADQLRSAGFDTGSNRANWQLYADGAEVSMKVLEDGAVVFFGRGLDTLTADTRVYYLINGNGGRRPVNVAGGIGNETAPATGFRVTIERKDRMAYISSILNGEAGNWFGPFINRNSETEQFLTVSDPDPDGGTAGLRIQMQGLTSGVHQVRVRINGTELGSVDFSGNENRSFDFEFPASALNSGANRVTLQSFGPGNDISLVDTVSLNYQRRFVAVNDRLRFGVLAGQSVRVGGFTESEIEIYELRNGQIERQVYGNIEKVDGTPGFSLSPAGYDREFIALVRNNYNQPLVVERNNPSTWNRSANGADLVIITPESLYRNAEELAKLRKGQGFRTEVVAVEDLYDEFSYGTHSPDAVKRFLEIATATWKRKPGYAILFGDSSFDPRNYLGQVNRDLVPTKLIDTRFMETSSDTWLADFNEDGIEDISLGRVPVSNLMEAGSVIRKLAGYDSQPERLPDSNLMVADRGFEVYHRILRMQIPENVQITTVERASVIDSKMRETILNGLNSGPRVVTYTGHGSTGLWAHYNIFNINDAAGLNNSQMSLYLLMTCLNGYTHNPYSASLAETLLLKERGGAILVWASSGETYSDKQFEMTQALNGFIFNREGVEYRIGDMVRSAKKATIDPDVRRTWQLIGDPTLFVK